jgi:hypothetical protein
MTVVFTRPEARGEQTRIRLELDREYSAEGHYIKVYTEAGYRMYTSAGSCSLHTRKAVEQVEERLQFTGEAKAALSKSPHRIDGWQWVGRGSPSPLFVDGEAVLPGPGLGILEVQYTVLFDRWELTSDADGTLVVGVSFPSGQDGEPAAAAAGQTPDGMDGADVDSVLVETGEGELTTTPYQLVVVDYCTGEVVPNARVYLAGKDMGATNSSGAVDLGRLRVGHRYGVKVTASGFFDSSSDTLSNEHFTVT